MDAERSTATCWMSVETTYLQSADSEAWTSHLNAYSSLQFELLDLGSALAAGHFCASSLTSSKAQFRAAALVCSETRVSSATQMKSILIAWLMISLSTTVCLPDAPEVASLECPAEQFSRYLVLIERHRSTHSPDLCCRIESAWSTCAATDTASA